MILRRVLAVLFIFISLSGCVSQTSSDSLHVERTYKLKEVLPGDDSVLFRVEGGSRNFWVHIGRISVRGFNPDLNDTHLWVQAARGVFGEVDLSRVYQAIVLPRTKEQQQKWESFIKEQKDILYGSNDVLPPDHPESNGPSR